MSYSGPNQNTGIYAKMTPQQGYKILLDKIRSDQHQLWLIRESRQEGMLTVDVITRIHGKPQPSSYRFALTPERWVMVQSDEQVKAVQGKISVKADVAANVAESLFKLLRENGFTASNRAIPNMDQQTQSSLYQVGYNVDTADDSTDLESDNEEEFDRPSRPKQ